MLEGKTVKITNVGLLEALYPDYTVKSSLFNDHHSNIIYCGSMVRGLHDYLSSNTASFINTVGPFDLNLDDSHALIELVYAKHSKKPSEGVLDLLSSLDDKSLYSALKIFWFTGKLFGIDEPEYSIYDLYKALTKSKQDLFKVYFSMLDSYSPLVIESSLLTFFEKAFNKEIEVSPGYRRLLDTFRERKGDKLKGLLYHYRLKRFAVRDVKIRLFWLLLRL